MKTTDATSLKQDTMKPNPFKVRRAILAAAFCCTLTSMLIIGCATERDAGSEALKGEKSPGAAESSAEAVLRQMSQKMGAATKFSFKVRREIDSGLAGGDGLHGNASITVKAERPDKVATRATIPGDVRCFYFDGKQLSLADEKKRTYSTVPLAATLDTLPSELATLYGFTPPVAEFLLSDLYADLVWRAQSFEYRGTGTITSGFLGLKRVRCHRVGVTGARADSELWIGVKDLLPRRWTSTVKGTNENVQIRLELSDWNLEAKTREEDFVLVPAEDALQVPMMTEAEMAAAHKPKK